MVKRYELEVEAIQLKDEQLAAYIKSSGLGDRVGIDWSRGEIFVDDQCYTTDPEDWLTYHPGSGELNLIEALAFERWYVPVERWDG